MHLQCILQFVFSFVILRKLTNKNLKYTPLMPFIYIFVLYYISKFLCPFHFLNFVGSSLPLSSILRCDDLITTLLSHTAEKSTNHFSRVISLFQHRQNAELANGGLCVAKHVANVAEMEPVTDKQGSVTISHVFKDGRLSHVIKVSLLIRIPLTEFTSYDSGWF